ncbi:hypothetical protein [Marinimicrobium locisalis]|uniref:hypothetical protein n=1 Tax=Marinimicrobium locisalis TaxID=546022 RepID=UPI003221503D
MATPISEHTEAVYLFSGDKLAREMLYPEFEAVLDGFVPVPEYANRTAKAAYLTISPQLTISAAVFFVIEFDARGLADRRWNLPLQQLIQQAGQGPDLGGGPIRLVCFSQCPVAWQQKNLWDPQMEPGRNSFVLLRKAVARNRLGLVRTESEPAPKKEPDIAPKAARQLKKVLHEHYSQAMRDRVARLLKEQRLRITTLANQQARKIDKLNREHQQRLQAYRNKVRQLQAQNSELTQRLETLKANFDAQVQKIEGMRDYFSHKLKAAHTDEHHQLQALRENYEMELAARVQGATSELEERLEMREMELFYRHQQENNLKEEVSRLRQENQTLLEQGGGQLLERLDKTGISFVAFHAGVGQLTVPPDEMAAYLDDPETFAARALGVEPELYKGWLKHSRNPQCMARDAHGHLCARAVPTVARPSDFHPGESDRCPAHQTLVAQRLAQ